MAQSSLEAGLTLDSEEAQAAAKSLAKTRRTRGRRSPSRTPLAKVLQSPHSRAQDPKKPVSQKLSPTDAGRSPPSPSSAPEGNASIEEIEKHLRDMGRTTGQIYQEAVRRRSTIGFWDGGPAPDAEEGEQPAEEQTFTAMQNMYQESQKELEELRTLMSRMRDDLVNNQRREMQRKMQTKLLSAKQVIETKAAQKERDEVREEMAQLQKQVFSMREDVIRELKIQTMKRVRDLSDADWLRRARQTVGEPPDAVSICHKCYQQYYQGDKTDEEAQSKELKRREHLAELVNLLTLEAGNLRARLQQQDKRIEYLQDMTKGDGQQRRRMSWEKPAVSDATIRVREFKAQLAQLKGLVLRMYGDMISAWQKVPLFLGKWAKDVCGGVYFGSSQGASQATANFISGYDECVAVSQSARDVHIQTAPSIIPDRGIELLRARLSQIGRSINTMAHRLDLLRMILNEAFSSTLTQNAASLKMLRRMRDTFAAAIGDHMFTFGEVTKGQTVSRVALQRSWKLTWDSEDDTTPTDHIVVRIDTVAPPEIITQEAVTLTDIKDIESLPDDGVALGVRLRLCGLDSQLQRALLCLRRACKEDGLVRGVQLLEDTTRELKESEAAAAAAGTEGEAGSGTPATPSSEGESPPASAPKSPSDDIGVELPPLNPQGATTVTREPPSTPAPPSPVPSAVSPRSTTAPKAASPVPADTPASCSPKSLNPPQVTTSPRGRVAVRRAQRGQGKCAPIPRSLPPKQQRTLKVPTADTEVQTDEVEFQVRPAAAEARLSLPELARKESVDEVRLTVSTFPSPAPPAVATPATPLPVCECCDPVPRSTWRRQQPEQSPRSARRHGNDGFAKEEEPRTPVGGQPKSSPVLSPRKPAPRPKPPPRSPPAEPTPLQPPLSVGPPPAPRMQPADAGRRNRKQSYYDWRKSWEEAVSSWREQHPELQSPPASVRMELRRAEKEKREQLERDLQAAPWLDPDAAKGAITALSAELSALMQDAAARRAPPRVSGSDESGAREKALGILRLLGHPAPVVMPRGPLVESDVQTDDTLFSSTDWLVHGQGLLAQEMKRRLASLEQMPIFRDWERAEHVRCSQDRHPVPFPPLARIPVAEAPSETAPTPEVPAAATTELPMLRVPSIRRSQPRPPPGTAFRRDPSDPRRPMAAPGGKHPPRRRRPPPAVFRPRGDTPDVSFALGCGHTDLPPL
eukprot:TRINITY_DN3556_c0_g1_i2.p1 TRINITY_DN3556_c0_g1~~TRINITY_DN3556_c0_g1_i2.p1  ORF type:complete len:1218 (+),score=305.24 TRINITY_DN3556_c0_g1_i2:58-3654(+)